MVEPTDTLLIICENGYGKRSNVDEFRKTNRGGKGVISIITNERNGEVIGALRVKDSDGVLMMSESGQTLRTSMKMVRVMGRSTQGVRLVQMQEGDKLVGAQRVTEDEE